MLQFSKFYRHCYELVHHQQNNNAVDPTQLEKNIIKLMAIIKSEKAKRMKSASIIEKRLHQLDQYLWTDEIEYIDQENFPEMDKQKIVNGLHRKNLIFGTYNKIFRLILPYIAQTNQNQNRACKILEIAGGSGQLAFFLAKKAKKLGLRIEMVSSDIVEHYVTQAKSRLKAKEHHSLIKFAQIDALALDQLPQGSYDLILNLHSLHHFSPEQLGKVFYGAQTAATKAFIAIDAYRGLRNILFIVGTALLPSIISMNLMYYHDALITARNMYPQQLLEAIAKTVCQKCEVSVKHISIGLSALMLKLDGGFSERVSNC